jgi:energy-converting hydrogenase Eha subunit A
MEDSDIPVQDDATLWPYATPPTGMPFGTRVTEGGVIVPATTQAWPGVWGAGPRPRSVTVAAWLTICLSAITAIALCVVIWVTMHWRESVLGAYRLGARPAPGHPRPESVLDVIAEVLGALVVWCVVAGVLARQVLRRSRGARLALTVSCALTIPAAFAGIGTLVAVVPLGAAIAVIVLLHSADSSRWFDEAPTPEVPAVPPFVPDLPTGPGSASEDG